MFKELRPEAKDLLERVSKFLLDEVAPNEQKFEQQIRKDQDRWNYYPEIVEEIKEKVRWCNRNDEECKKIVINGVVFFNPSL